MIVFKGHTEKNHDFLFGLLHSILCNTVMRNDTLRMKFPEKITSKQNFSKIGFNNRIKPLREMFLFVFPNRANCH